MEVARALMRLREDYVAGRGPYAAGAWEEKNGIRRRTRRAMLKTFSWKKMTEGLMREAAANGGGGGGGGDVEVEKSSSSRKKKRKKKTKRK